MSQHQESLNVIRNDFLDVSIVKLTQLFIFNAEFPKQQSKILANVKHSQEDKGESRAKLFL